MEEIVLSGVQLGAFVLLFVQALKFLGVVDEKQLRFGALGGAVLFAALWFLVQFVPAAEPYVSAVIVGIVAIMSAVLGYGYAVRPLAERLGIDVRASDINSE